MNIKGHTDIILTNVKTGEVEKYSDDNMVTNAIAEHMANCGFLNKVTVDETKMVEQLLGGVMAFDETITEAATTVHAPANLEMTANGSVGEVNDSAVLELGSWSETESGWQQDGAYIQTYDYTTTQANGKISCVCLTGKDYGFVGEGNGISGESMATRRNLNLVGTPLNTGAYFITGYACRLNLIDSTIYGVDMSDIANSNITIRKFQLPLTKVNLKGTPTAPIVLSETTITAPVNLVSEMVIPSGSYRTPPNLGDGSIQDTGDRLMILSRAESGDTWAQKLWEIDPVNATITESDLSNTSGDTLHSMCCPVWMGKDCVCFIDGWDGYTYNAAKYGTKVYSMKRTNGVWDTIQKCTNPAGADKTSYETSQCGWKAGVRRTTDRCVVNGGTGQMLLFDFQKNKCWKTNGAYNYGEAIIVPSYDKPLIRYNPVWSDNQTRIDILRDQTYIASINNLSAPVTKTPEKTMKIVYRLTFTN